MSIQHKNAASMIAGKLSPTVLYLQLAEEAAELSAAAAKMARYLDGTNPTSKDKSENDIYFDLMSEYADVMNCAIQLNLPIDWRLVLFKMGRWENRLGMQICSDDVLKDISEGKKAYHSIVDGKDYGGQNIESEDDKEETDE